MDNLNAPAYPVDPKGEKYSGHSNIDGFTKLELAALMIAQGLTSELGKEIFWSGDNIDTIASRAVSIARHVLEEANK